MATDQEPSQEPGPAEQDYEQELPPEEELRKRSGTPISTWVAVFGSSTVFHVLLLVLLGMIIISEQQNVQEEVTMQIPEESKDQKQEITMQDIKKEIEQKSKVENPEVEQETMEEMENEQPEKSGESLEFTSDTSNDQKTERAIALDSGGSGGKFGDRGTAGSLGSGDGASGSTQKAVDAALDWLAKHQNDAGFWDADSYDKQCPDGNKCKVFVDGSNEDVGVTGLTLLAFLGAGYTHESNQQVGGVDAGHVVMKGLRWLKGKQGGNGKFGGGRQMYTHAIATMAYAEAYGMTRSPRLKRIAQKGIDFLEHAQNTSGGEKSGWRYSPNSGDSDTSVTGWCAMALKSGELAGLETSEASMQGALRFVEQVTNDRGLTGYKEKITSRGRIKNDRALTPVGMLVRMFAHDKLNERQLNFLKKGAEFAVSRLPEWNEDAEYSDGHSANKMDYYYWYYGSLALFMFAGPDTPFEQLGYWQKWNKPMQQAVLSGMQTASEGHEMGSWDPVSRWSKNGGRVYTTALNTLTLEVYYRYDNALFQ